MKIFNTALGRVLVSNPETIFEKIIDFIENSVEGIGDRHSRIGFSGGSTPCSVYRWAYEKKIISHNLFRKCLWMVSDERHVSLSSQDSNFGNLDRLLLQPCNVPHENKHPWPIKTLFGKTAETFNNSWDEKFGQNSGFDVCFLGMGSDCHIASLFPECHIIGSSKEKFSAVEWPGRGNRLTITETGLQYCRQIVVLVIGKQKARAFYKVMNSDYSPSLLPAQVLRNHADRVTWLVDSLAANL